MKDISASLGPLRLSLSAQELIDIRLALTNRLREGAANDGRELAMLPAWLAPPRADLQGEAIAIDAGGTNLRAARVRAGEHGVVEVLGSIEEAPLPGAAGRDEASAAEFFAAHTALVTRLGAPAGTPIGYCFSYPTTVLPDGDAVPLRWTKEVRVPGVIGERVGTLLVKHLREGGISPGQVFILNDTIAALAAGSLGPGVVPSRAIGLIVGTGTNMGAYLPMTALTKLTAPDWSAPSMAVNFESGAFVPPHLGPVDADVDSASLSPGAQRFEKAVSGAYLGRLFSAAARRLELDGTPAEVESAEVSRLAVEAQGSAAGTLARVLLDRSADLVAASLAATSDVLAGKGDLFVFAEGSLIARGPGYADRVRTSLEKLLDAGGTGARVHITFRRDANLLGSALAALAHQQRG